MISGVNAASPDAALRGEVGFATRKVAGPAFAGLPPEAELQRWIASAVAACRRSEFQVGGVPDAHQAIAKRQDLADQAAALVSIMQCNGVDADVDTQEFEAKVRICAKSDFPVTAESLLAADRAPAFGNESRRGGRREDDIVGIVSEHGLDIAGVPGGDPPRGEFARLWRGHGKSMPDAELRDSGGSALASAA